MIDGRFVIERFVARGGMGEVYRALDRTTRKPVAVKVMALDDEIITERFALESRALLELDHPAVVRYVAHGQAPGVGHYLVMEWLDGVTLSAWLRRHSLSLDQTLRLAIRVAEGLGSAHQRGMIHRDVKPANLFLVGRRVEWAKVLDFGLVRNPWQHITATGAGLGTPEYMSPEQARCERTVGPASDIFSLGTVLYRCITGQRAFEDKQVKVLLAKLAMFEHPPRISDVRPDVPAALVDLIAAMMAQAPEDRPADGIAAAALLRKARSGLSAAAREATPTPAPSLTTSEQLPAAVLFVDIERPFEPPQAVVGEHPSGTVYFGRRARRTAPPSFDTDPVARQIRDVAVRTGGRVGLLATGSVVVTLSGGGAAPELAIRAARCALAIHAAVPTATISLATRQVVVDDQRGAAGIIDSAAAMARARCIRIDNRTRDLLPDRFEVEGDAAAGWVLVAERAPEADAEVAPRRLLGREMPCVGRQSVLRQLSAVFDGVVEDRAARAIVIMGEPGVGKSRVRAELVTRLRDREVRVLTAGGEPLRAGVPGGVIARAIRAAAPAADDQPAARRAALRARVDEVVPEAGRERVAEFLGEVAGIPADGEGSAALRAARSDPRFMAERQRRAVEDWLAAECEARPLALIIDDLQWADAVSVDLIEAALRRARDLPLVVLAFARPEVQHRFPKLDVAWGRDEIRLEPLRPAACEQLVREALGDDAEPTMVARLVEHSGGNPFYLEELIRTAASAEPASLPGSVLASLQLRIGGRPPRARLVLRAASVFGRTFWAGGVTALLAGEMDRPEIDEWLAVLERDELIELRGPSRAFPGELEYAFRHDLLRDASYHMLTAEDRLAGHQLAGAWLVEHGEGDALVLAEHFAGGGATAQAVSFFQRAAEGALHTGVGDVAAIGKAASYYRRAGETCAAAYANDAAIEHLERATALWSPIDPVEAARTRLALAGVREVAGDPDAALADLAAAEEDLIAAGGADPLRVEVLLARAQVLGRSGAEGALERALETGETALELARKAGPRELELRAMTSLAGILLRAETEPAIARAVELARRAAAMSEDRGPLARALWRLGNAFLAGNQLEPATRLYADALASAEANHDELLVALCTSNMSMLAFRRWRLDEAIVRAQQALERYERIGYQARILETTLNLGVFLHRRGDAERGRELLGNVLGQARGDWVLTTLAQETLADIERLDGREARAQARLRAAARICEKVGATKKRALYLGMLAESLWTTGEPGAAIAALEQGAQAATSLTLSHAFVLLQLGQLDDAVEWLEKFVEGEPDLHRRVLARLGLARAHAWQGRAADARAQCEAALGALEPSPVPRYVLQVRCLARALEGDAAGAVAALAEAEAACAPHEYAEAALDVGEGLVSQDPADDVVRRYLELSADVPHRGIRYHVEDLRSALYARIADRERALECVAAANQELDHLLERIEGDYRSQMAGHPWVQALRRVRALP